MRLIDADELLKKLSPNYDETKQLIKGGETHLDTLAEGYTEVSILINDAPTVEAESVRHGHWEESCNELNKYCSECKKVCGTIYENENYCPNCGAKMNEVEE